MKDMIRPLNGAHKREREIMIPKSIGRKAIGKDIIKTRIKKWMRYESGLHFDLWYAIVQHYTRTLYSKAMSIAFIRVITHWNYACAFTKDHTWTSNNIEGESDLTSTLVIFPSNKRTIFYFKWLLNHVKLTVPICTSKKPNKLFYTNSPPILSWLYIHLSWFINSIDI